MYYMRPRNVSCEAITEPDLAVEIPYSPRLNFHYSLTGGTTTIIRDAEAAKDVVTVKVEFDSLEGDKSLFCSAQFKRSVVAGAFVSPTITESEVL